MRIPSRALVLIACLISLLADPVHSQWQQIKLPRSAAGRSEIVSANGMLFVRGMFRSLDNGDSWEKCGSQEIGPFFIQGGEIFGCTPDLKIWKSSNWGQSWSLLINTPIPKSVISISRTSAGVFLALTGHEVYRYNAVQQNWQNTTAFPTLLTPKAWWIRGNDVWICCLQGLYRSNNSGQSWNYARNTIAPPDWIYGHGDTLLVNFGSTLHRSVDFGANWAVVNLNFYASPQWINGCWYAYQSSGIRSCDGGLTWEKVGKDQHLPQGISYFYVAGNRWLISCQAGLLLSDDAAQTFVLIFDFPDYTGPLDWFLSPKHEVVGNYLAATYDNWTPFTNNDGQHWFAPHLLGASLNRLEQFVEKDGKWYALGDNESGVFRAETNNLHQWALVSNPFSSHSAVTFFKTGGKLTYLDLLDGLSFYQSDDNGSSWHHTAGYLPADGSPLLAVYDDMLFTVSYQNKKIYRSTDSGVSWSALNDTSLTNNPNWFYQSAFYRSGDGLFLEFSGLSPMVSLDKGNTWMDISHGTPIGQDGGPVRPYRYIALQNTILMASSEGVYRRMPDSTWMSVGLPLGKYTELCNGNGAVYAIREDVYQIWKHPYAGLVSAPEIVKPESWMVSVAPNPATTRTRFEWLQPLAQAATLRVWSAGSKPVISLQVPEGFSYIDVPVHSLPQGIYFWEIYDGKSKWQTGSLQKM